MKPEYDFVGWKHGYV